MSLPKTNSIEVVFVAEFLHDSVPNVDPFALLEYQRRYGSCESSDDGSNIDEQQYTDENNKGQHNTQIEIQEVKKN